MENYTKQLLEDLNRLVADPRLTLGEKQTLALAACTIQLKPPPPPALDGYTAMDVLVAVSVAYDGKQMYFPEDNGLVYDRYFNRYCTFSEAVESFVSRISA